MNTTERPHIYIIGDSHAAYFAAAAKYSLFFPFKATSCAVPDASAAALAATPTERNAAGKFAKFLDGIAETAIIIIHLGEADCGVLLWQQAAAAELPVASQLPAAIAALGDFLDRLVARGHRNIIVTGATMPTITADDTGRVATARKSVTATQAERTALTTAFNAAAAAAAAARGLYFADIAAQVIDPASGLVAACYRHAEPTNHMMDSQHAASAWATALYPILAGIAGLESEIITWQPRREIVYIKCLKHWAGHMPADLSYKVLMKTLVTGRSYGLVDDHYVVADVTVDGAPVPPQFRLMHNDLFEVLTEPQILGVGDSHVWYLKVADENELFQPIKARVSMALGATAVGMRNPQSMTNSIGQFRDFLKGKNRNSVVVIHLGENDCGFVIWYRAKKYDESIEQQTAESIGAYFEFVDELLDKGFHRIIITGSTLPTIAAGDEGPVAGSRKSISATHVERTELTHEYNRQLAEQAQARGLPYVDITAEVIDPATGLVAEIFRHPDKNDHHMHWRRAGLEWAAKIFPLAADLLADDKDWRSRLDVPRASFTPAGATASIDGFKGAGMNQVEDLQLAVQAGSILTGRYFGIAENCHVLANIEVDGKPVHPRYRFIKTLEWVGGQEDSSEERQSAISA